MTAKKEPMHEQAGHRIVITRVFDAPRELVWKAWTDPENFKRWWGPKGFTAPVSRMDLRVGGRYFNCMRSPEGQEYWTTGVYREVVPLERLVLTDSFSDEKGSIVPASHYDMPGDWPMELLVTVTLEDIGGRTKMTLEHAGLPAGTMTEQTEAGWNESFDKLDESIRTGTWLIAEPGKQEIVFTHVFNAPRRLVFQAYTDPSIIPHWFGPRRYTTIVDKIDVKRGGMWRFLNRDAGGNEFAFHGVYHDVVLPERIVWTFEFEGMPGHVSLESVTFEENEGKTMLTGKSVYQSVEDRDGMLQAGMEEGMAESLERLDEFLAKPGVRENAA
jgi:uncharacterized protein YndB with AHSA1/START domain